METLHLVTQSSGCNSLDSLSLMTDLHALVVEEEHQLPGVGDPLVDEQQLLTGQTYAGLSLHEGEGLVKVSKKKVGNFP